MWLSLFLSQIAHHCITRKWQQAFFSHLTLTHFPSMCLQIKHNFCINWGFITYSGKQCAAETIQRLEMMDPPHWWTPSYCKLTCQGQLPCLASTPPTIRSAAKLRLPQSAEAREEKERDWEIKGGRQAQHVEQDERWLWGNQVIKCASVSDRLSADLTSYLGTTVWEPPCSHSHWNKDRQS